jgi:multisubunit Na+/H+ antiporter MnhE subunit
MRGERRTQHVVKHPRVTFVATIVLMALLWVLFVAGTKGQEMLVGVGAVSLSLLFLWGVAHTSPLALDFRAQDVFTFWRIPLYLVSDAWTVLVVLFKSCFGQPAGSYYRVTGFDSAPRDPQRNARQVLATAYTTATPNSIVLGVDIKSNRMLFHQLQRSKTNKLLKSLGARS